MLPIKSSGKFDSPRIGRTLDLFSGFPGKLILSDILLESSRDASQIFLLIYYYMSQLELTPNPTLVSQIPIPRYVSSAFHEDWGIMMSGGLDVDGFFLDDVMLTRGVTIPLFPGSGTIREM